LSVGHANWGGGFLFPWLIGLLIELFESRQGWSWVAKVAFLMFFMLINGAFHQFIWGMMLIGLTGLALFRDVRKLGVALGAVVASGLLSAWRLLPPALGLGQFDDVFISGYPRPINLAQAVVSLVPPAQAYGERLAHAGLGWWEMDLYLGIAGAALVLFFGGILWLRNQFGKERQYPAFWLPAVVLGVLSLWKFYQPFAQAPIPLFSSERVSSRLLIIPFMLAIVIASVNMQRWLDGGKRPVIFQVGLLGLLGWMTFDLVRHLNLWQVNVAYTAFPITPTNLAIKVVGNHADPLYFTVLWAGLAVTLVCAAVLIGMAWVEKRRSVR
jgi:hypothetical protein